jgi:hypothetical protein
MGIGNGNGHRNGKNGNNGLSLRASNDTNVNRLLRELHQKKRWLDTMIEGLEAAAGSPHHQLIERTGQIFEHLNGSRPKVDLRRPQQQILAGLASQVGRRRPRRANRSDVKAA